jgi:hypothetical protein
MTIYNTKHNNKNVTLGITKVRIMLSVALVILQQMAIILIVIMLNVVTQNVFILNVLC